MHGNPSGPDFGVILTLRRARQCCFTGHSPHSGALGAHTVAPSSIRAWLKSPGRLLSTRALAMSLGEMAVSGMGLCGERAPGPLPASCLQGGMLLGRQRQHGSFLHHSQQHQLPKSSRTPRLSPFAGSAPHSSRVILPSTTKSTATIAAARSGDGVFPLPEPVDDGRAAGVGTNAPQAAQDPDHVPIHDAGSLGPGAGVTVPGGARAPGKAGSWGAPRMERGHTQGQPAGQAGR